MLTYTNAERPKLKKWQIGVIALSSFSFKQPQKKTHSAPLRVINTNKSSKTKKRVERNAKGIDLSLRHNEVKKIFLKHCSKMCLDNGCDPEDVLQEVYKGIIIRNSGKCPFDESKSAFSTYVVMVSKCVTINYVNKIGKKTYGEVYGKEDTIENEDHNIGGCEESSAEDVMYFSQLRNLLKKEQAEIYDDLLDGYKISHISRRRSIDSRKVNKYISEIRKILLPYMESEMSPC